jgi:ribose transport system permease protein
MGLIAQRVRVWAARAARSSLAGPYVIVAVLFVTGSLASARFSSVPNIRQLLVFASFTSLAALGQSLVIIGGGIDLSVPWLMGFGGLQLAHWSNGGLSQPIAIVVVVVVGAVIGGVNAAGVTLLRVPPIIMTLAVGGVVYGYLLDIGQVGYTSTAPTLAVTLTSKSVGAIPVVALITLGLAIATHFFLRRTVGGRWLFAVGTDQTIARLAGVRVGATRAATYVVSGATAAFAGILLAGYVGQSYPEIGQPYLFTSIAAVAIGGASILGGSGSFWGTIAGALTLTLLTATLALLNVSDAVLDIVYGLVIVLAVLGAQNVGRRHFVYRDVFRRNLRVPSVAAPELVRETEEKGA